MTVAQVFLIVIFGVAGIFAVISIVGQAIESRKERKAEYERRHKPWDPVLCTHEWETSNSGTCENTYSSYGSGVEQREWYVECCTHCGTKRFYCSDSSCMDYDKCRAIYEDHQPASGPLERTLIERVADKNGFEYAHYLLKDRFGNKREAYYRVVPTTIPFSCPDCGGMVVGVDAQRVWPGSTGQEPTSFRCENCGRQEDHEFGVPRVEYREGEPSFAEPAGKQEVCPSGGKHEWETLDTWSETDFPEGIDPCLENLSFLEEVWYKKLRCTKCGKEQVVTE